MPFLLNPRPSRRSFLVTAGAAATGVVFGTARGGAQAGPLRLALLSDTHVPADPAETYRGFAPVQNLTRVVPQVVSAKVQGALFAGDIARLQGLPEDYARVRELIAPITSAMPAGFVLGNHDHRANFSTAFTPGTSAVKGKLATTRDIQGLRFILLDSLLSPNVTPGQLGTAQREWLSTELAASTTPTILVLHHTLNDSDGALVDSDRFMAIAARHRHVKAIVFGHSHVYEVTEREGIQLINLPAVGYNFSDSQPVGWVESAWTPDGVDLTLHAIGGNVSGNGQTTSVHWAR